jgi:hypothetical protein
MAVLWILKICLELLLYIGNWFFDFLRAMVVDPKTITRTVRGLFLFLITAQPWFSPILHFLRFSLSLFSFSLCGVFLSSLSFELLSYQHHRFSVTAEHGDRNSLF